MGCTPTWHGALRLPRPPRKQGSRGQLTVKRSLDPLSSMFSGLATVPAQRAAGDTESCMSLA